MGGRESQGLRRVAEALLGLTLIAAPLAIGGAHAHTQGALALATAVALAIMLRDRRARGGRLAITVPTVALVVALVATLVQLVPVPPGVIAVLSPLAADTFATTLGAHGWRGLTLDGAATLAEAAKLALYAAFFVAATLYASRSARRRALVLTVIAAAVACALVGFAQALVGSTRVLFFYRPHGQILNEILVRGPFVNPNHFGALLALAAPLALIWGIREPARRWQAFGAVVILNVGVVLSMSRGALVGAFVGQGLVFALDHRLRSGGRSTRKQATTLALLGLAGLVGIAGLVGVRAVLDTSHPALGSLTDTSGKRYVWGRALSLAWSHPWTGIGRGAFEQAFTRVTSVGGTVTHQWSENAYLEAMVSWGIPTALLLGLLFLLTIRLSLARLGRDPLAVGAVAALAGLAVHELADFAIELPGVALPALAILASLFGSRSSEDMRAQKRVKVRWPWLLAPVVPCALAVATFARPSAAADAARLHALAEEPTVSLDRFLTEAERARTRHPADFRVAAVVATRLAEARHPDALRWLNDTMYLNPTHPGAHLVAAELLAGSGHKEQALIEYRAALEVSPGSGSLWTAVGRRYPKFEDLLRAAPATVPGYRGLTDWLWTQARWPDAARVLLVARELGPQVDPQILRLQVAVALRGGLPEAIALATELATLAPGEEANLALAEAELIGGTWQEARKSLNLLVQRTRAQIDLELRLVERLVAAGELDAARERLDGLGWSLAREDRARVHEARAGIERSAGNEHQVRWELEQAARLRGP